MIEIKTLNPQTLEEDPNGQTYEVETVGGNTIVSAHSDPVDLSVSEPIPTLEDKINYLYYKSQGVI